MADKNSENPPAGKGKKYLIVLFFWSVIVGLMLLEYLT